MEEKTLLEQAKQILDKVEWSAEQKALLRNIKTLMVVEFSKYAKLFAQAKKDYKICKNEKKLELMKTKKSDGKLYSATHADVEAELHATKMFGDIILYEITKDVMKVQINHV